MDLALQPNGPTTSEQEIALTRVFHAPRRRVYEAFTQPQHLREWWGPDRFTLASCEVDPRVGGALHLVMRAPDGRTYGFHGSYVEVLPPARLAFTADLDEAPEHLLTTANFEEVDGSTWLTVRQTFPRSPEYAAGQRDGWSESLERLALYLAGF